MKKTDSKTKNKDIMQANIVEIIADIEKISESFDKITADLGSESQTLIQEINQNVAELKFSAGTAEDQIQTFQKLEEALKALKAQLKQLPFSDRPIINNLCKAINTVLEKLADYFLNGPIVGKGVYIPLPNAKPHHFDFFHPCKPINTSIEKLLENLNSPSLAA